MKKVNVKKSDVYWEWYFKIANLIAEDGECAWLRNPVIFKKKGIEYKIEAVSEFSLTYNENIEYGIGDNLNNKLFFSIREINKVYDFKYTTFRESFLKRHNVDRNENTISKIFNWYSNKLALNSIPLGTAIYGAEYLHFTEFSIDIIKAVYLEMFKVLHLSKLEKESKLDVDTLMDEEKVILLDYNQKSQEIKNIELLKRNDIGKLI